MEPELNREASSSSPEWPTQAAPVFAGDETHLDREQITTPLRPASPQQQHLNQQLAQQLEQLGEQRERQLERQLSQVRNELAAMEGLMAEVSQIFELKFKQRLKPILEENNGLRQQLDQLYRQLRQLKPQQRQAQPYHSQPAQLAPKQPSQPAELAQNQQPQPAQLPQNQPPQPAQLGQNQPPQLPQIQQPQLPQLKRPQRQINQRQTPQLQAAESTATQASRSNANTAIVNITSANGEDPSTINSNNSNQGVTVAGCPKRIRLTRRLRLHTLLAALLHALGWRRRVKKSAADFGPRP